MLTERDKKLLEKVNNCRKSFEQEGEQDCEGCYEEAVAQILAAIYDRLSVVYIFVSCLLGFAVAFLILQL